MCSSHSDVTGKKSMEFRLISTPYSCWEHSRSVLIALGPDEDIVDVAAAEAFDIAGPTLYQQTITEFQWEAGMLYQLRHKYFLPFEALLLVSDIIRDSYDRNVVMIQDIYMMALNRTAGVPALDEQQIHFLILITENLRAVVSNNIFESTWNKFFPAVMPREVILNPNEPSYEWINDPHFGDIPASNFVAGFKEGVGAAKLHCCSCLIDHDDIELIHLESNCVLRNKDTHEVHVLQIENVEFTSVEREGLSTTYGVNRRCPFTRVGYVDPTKIFSHDLMHVVNEGILNLVVRKLLRHLIVTIKLDLDVVNRKISTLSCDREFTVPPPIRKKEVMDLTKLSFSSSEMGSVAIALAVVLAEFVEDSTVLEKNIEIHNINHVLLNPKNPDESGNAITPKLHSLLHLANQIRVFGALRNSWCFRNVPWSLSSHHQKLVGLDVARDREGHFFGNTENFTVHGHHSPIDVKHACCNGTLGNDKNPCLPKKKNTALHIQPLAGAHVAAVAIAKGTSIQPDVENHQRQLHPNNPLELVVVDNRFVQLSLPNEGIEPWEINERLVKAIKAGQLTLYFNQFILVCAKHLMQTHRAHRFKNHYRNYADMIFNKFPCLKDVGRNCSYETLKDKIIKAIQNQTGSSKSMDARKLKRASVKSAAADSLFANGDGASNISDTSNTTGDSDGDKEIELIAKFNSRRSFVHSNKKKTTRDILETIPHYKEFANVKEDFMKMPAVSVIGQGLFRSNFDDQMDNLRHYFIWIKGPNFDEGVRGTLQILLLLNQLCSSKQGAKSNTPVITSREKGNSVDLNYSVKSMGEAMFNLLSLYYVFDHNYPAVYGVLLLLERYCLCNKGSGVRRTKGDPSSWRKFTNNFEKWEEFMNINKKEGSHLIKEITDIRSKVESFIAKSNTTGSLNNTSSSDIGAVASNGFGASSSETVKE
uniref:Uncharacterized protein n=1 Tax=Daphnia galeata TaxID=27404 RepID=A0A8J2RIX4_9CRUS|nr:unnamed protein product [Daphnia galeata]